MTRNALPNIKIVLLNYLIYNTVKQGKKRRSSNIITLQINVAENAQYMNIQSLSPLFEQDARKAAIQASVSIACVAGVQRGG